MTETANFPTFGRIVQLFEHDDPSEIHGMLCGMLCADTAIDSAAWLTWVKDEFSQDVVQTREAEKLLRELFVATVSQFNDEDFGLLLMLPDEEAPLSRRADSLGCWCEGFLSGLGLGGVDKNQGFSAQVQEFLSDLLDIARLDCDISEPSDDDEESYTEIVEYVRMGVLLVNQELRSRSSIPSRLH